MHQGAAPGIRGQDGQGTNGVLPRRPTWQSGAATQAVYTCGSPPGGGRDGREESGLISEGPGELDRVPLLLFWDSGDTNTTPSVGVGKGQAGSRKVSGKQKDSSLVIAGIPTIRLLKE